MTGPKKYSRRAIESCERKAKQLREKAEGYDLLAVMIEAGELDDVQARRIWALVSFEEEL